MKILWLVNIVMPELAKHLGRKPSVFGGWLTGALNAVQSSGNELVICTTETKVDNSRRYEIDGIIYYICTKGDITVMQSAFTEGLANEKPDVIHIYGTEFEQSWALMSVSDPEKTVVQIQGGMAELSKVVYAGIPERIANDNLLHKLLRKVHKGGTSIELQKISFESRAVVERKVLERAKYITGGSEWGNEFGRTINPDAHFFNCNLILRDCFYTEERWSYENCEKHSIYILFTYPIKGFHKFLEALPTVVSKYPDTKVYIAGNRLAFRHYGKLKTMILNHAQDYNWYVQNLIERYRLEPYLNFIGYLHEQQVKERMLKSHVFVSASAMENQSTTLGEAMLLGVPSVASCVGAIQEMIDDGEDGFLYPFHEPYVLADRIMKIFDDAELAEKFSLRGHEHAARTYDRNRNSGDLLHMYETIANQL